jgi:subtilisin family serine protease
MPEFVITFKDSVWRDLLSESMKARPTIDLSSILPETEGPRPKIYPKLGFAVVSVSGIESGGVVDTLRNHTTIEEVSSSIAFDTITPIGGFRRTDLLGDLIPTWHFDLTNIDKLHKNGLTGDGVTVGVMDTGVDLHTPQIQGRISRYASFDESGTVINSPIADQHGHGTFVCGIIAGQGFGVAPKVSLVVARIAPSGSTSFPKILGALEWFCTEFPLIRVINMSAGKLEDPSTSFITAVRRLEASNKMLVCAIGNEGENSSRTPGNISGVLGVGAIDINKQVAPFSGGMNMSLGGQTYVKPDLVMPGVDIPSCIPGGDIRLGSGTSEAAPIATGLVALMLQATPDLDSCTIMQRVLDSCVELPAPPIRDGKGLPDALHC